jgi:hypothetical protein
MSQSTSPVTDVKTVLHSRLKNIKKNSTKRQSTCIYNMHGMALKGRSNVVAGLLRDGKDFSRVFP